MKLAIPVNLTTASVMVASLVILIFFSTKQSAPDDADIIINLRDDERVIRTLQDLEKEVLKRPEGIVKVALVSHRALVLPFWRMPDEGVSELDRTDVKFGDTTYYFAETEVSQKALKSKLKDIFKAHEALNALALVRVDFEEKPTPLKLVFKTLKPIIKEDTPVKIVTAETIREMNLEEVTPASPTPGVAQ